MTDTTPDYAGLEALEQAIIGYWGNRCSDFDGNCPCCQSWKQFDALRTLLESNAALERERDEARRQSDRFCDKYLAALSRAEAAEAKLAEAMKVIGQIDNALNDQFAAGIEEREGGSARRQERLMKSGEELRRAARKFLKENGNGNGE